MLFSCQQIDIFSYNSQDYTTWLKLNNYALDCYDQIIEKRMYIQQLFFNTKHRQFSMKIQKILCNSTVHKNVSYNKQLQMYYFDTYLNNKQTNMYLSCLVEDIFKTKIIYKPQQIKMT